MTTRHWAVALQRLDQQIEQRRVALQLLAIGAMDGHQHAVEFVIGGRWPLGDLAQARLDRPQPGGGDFLEQRRLGGKVAIDVGVGHAGVLSDADDGRPPGAELANMSARNFKDARLNGVGTRRLLHVRSIHSIFSSTNEWSHETPRYATRFKSR